MGQTFRSRRMIFAAAFFIAIAVVYWFVGNSKNANSLHDVKRLPPVYVETARREALNVQIKALGTITPLATVSVRSRVDGELIRILFKEGQQVTKDQLLAEIDPRPFHANLTQVTGERQQSSAQLAQARRELEQHRQLHRDGFTTQTKVDQQTALVDQYGGAVKTNDGRIADAKLQLEYARVRAPISGRIGLREVDAGNMVRGGDTTQIATITQMQPISALFTIPEAQIDEVRQAMRGGGSLIVEAWDRGERTVLATGKLTTVDNRIDAGSGTLRMRGEFSNSDERLLPNQFVNVRLRVRTIADAVTVPASAIQHGAQGAFVYVVDKDGLARRRMLAIGASDGTRTQILNGVAAGETIILEGHDRVKDGQKVEIIATPKAGATSAPIASVQ